MHTEELMPAVFAHKDCTSSATLIIKSSLIKSELHLHAGSMQPFKGRLLFDALGRVSHGICNKAEVGIKRQQDGWLVPARGQAVTALPCVWAAAVAMGGRLELATGPEIKARNWKVSATSGRDRTGSFLSPSTYVHKVLITTMA